MSRIAPLFLVLAILVAVPLAGQTKKKGRGHGEPGVFDYYILSLSWSPQYCSSPAGSGNAEQCSAGREYGCVVHGLVPQYEKGYPESCEPTDPVRSGIDRSMPRPLPR